MFTSTVKVGGSNDRETQSATSPAAGETRSSERTFETDSSSETEPPSLIGPKLRDPERYSILGEHGRGGLGRVSRAHDRELGRDVAIKELISRGKVDEVRFLREAMITARLEHPGIVPVHEAGRWPDGTPFYAMKLVSGRSLRDLISERATIDQRLDLLHHVIAVADAIAYAHGRNIIHRDLKPGNVIVGDFGETIVIDWGLAKDITASEDATNPGDPDPVRVHHGDDELTAAGSVLGTPAYMAPEQKRGEPVDQRADVFAIGAMLWELCSLKKTLPSNPQQRQRMLRRAGIDQDLIAIISKALDPDPAQRYRDAGALAADLKAFKSGARISARDYSLLAMLAHWTRRHHALAVSVGVMLVLATSGVVVYIRNIAAERDRADAALRIARTERDRAKLSEASLLLEKDPIRAKEMLAELPLHSPQHSLLTSRARQLAAARVVPISAVIDGMFRAPGGDTVQLVTRDGGFHRLDPVNGKLETLDQDLTGAVAYRAGQWLYARRTYGASSVRIATPSTSNLLGADLASASRITALNDAVYALDAAGDLHRLDGKTSTVVDHAVRNIVGDGNLRMVCKLNGELDVVRDNTVVFHGRCPATKNAAGMAVVHDDYAALTAEWVLMAVRDGRRVDIPTPIQGEYELAMSSDGVIAIADYSKAMSWFVRPGGSTLEAGPVHASQLFSVAADGNLAVWGYGDGTVIVLDTAVGAVWELRGTPGWVVYVVVDAAHARVVAAGTRELRIWELKAPAGSLVTSMPCVIFHIQPSPDGSRVALDCNDGSVRLWSRDSGAVTPVHAHAGASYGVQWVNGLICSGGYRDGRLLCSKPDGTDTQRIDSGTSRITWLTAGPEHDFLIFASADGKVWRFDGKLQELYTHRAVYRIALSADGRLLGSCALDGTLAIYDLGQRKLIAAQLPDHKGPAYSVGWVDDELWTAGDDGLVKRWVVGEGATLRHSLNLKASVHRMNAARGGWAANTGEDVLLVGRDDGTVTLNLRIGRTIDALDVSPDRRFVAAGVDGEIVVVDVERRAIATMMIGAPVPKQLSFLDATSLAFSEVSALKIVQVDKLEYVPFQPSGLTDATL